MLPLVKEYSAIGISGTKLLIVAGGFETRTLAWLDRLEEPTMFDETIICKYILKKSRYLDVLKLVKKHTKTLPISLKYDRFEPTSFETQLRTYFLNADKYDDIYVDITVMSKLLIMIIINELRKYKNNLHLIYTEPIKWGPSEQQYKEAMGKEKMEVSFVYLLLVLEILLELQHYQVLLCKRTRCFSRRIII